MPTKTKMEKVTIELPKAVMDFLRSVEANPEKYLQHSIVEIVQSDLNSGEIWGPKEITKRFDLNSVFKATEN